MGLEVDGVRSCRGLLFINFWLELRRRLIVNGSGCWWRVLFYCLALLLFGYFFRNVCIILCLLRCLVVFLLFCRLLSLSSLAKNLFCSLPRWITPKQTIISCSFSGGGIKFHFKASKAIGFFSFFSFFIFFNNYHLAQLPPLIFASLWLLGRMLLDRKQWLTTDFKEFFKIHQR